MEVQAMNKSRAIVTLMGLAAVVAILVACSNGEASVSAGTSSPPDSSPVAKSNVPNDNTLTAVAGTAPQSEGGQALPPVGGVVQPTGPVTAEPRSLPPVEVPVVDATNAGQGFASVSVQTGNSQTGIWVTGEGTVTLEPDLVLLNLGVEATAKSVAEARNEAADAMAAIAAALRARQIEDKDIQTQFFSISPQYQFIDVVEGGVRTRKQIVVGYRVSNTALVKIRDLDVVGEIVDEVAAAGGDSTRINGIRFTVESPKPMMAQLREQAVKDALAKAQQFASLTGVALGRLLFISESGGGAPVVRDFGQRAFLAEAAPAPVTSISGGELELRMSVQAVFDIQ
jgi:uncharacterized protein YggE